jgi:hypothetical protein
MKRALTLTNDVAKLYVDYWIAAIPHLLGWDRTRILEWAERSEELLNDESSLLFHEAPTYLLTSLLVPKSARENLTGTALSSLGGRLEDALFMKDYSEKALQGFDWGAAVARVDSVLRECGIADCSLESVREEYRVGDR